MTSGARWDITDDLAVRGKQRRGFQARRCLFQGQVVLSQPICIPWTRHKRHPTGSIVSDGVEQVRCLQIANGGNPFLRSSEGETNRRKTIVIMELTKITGIWTWRMASRAWVPIDTQRCCKTRTRAVSITGLPITGSSNSGCPGNSRRNTGSSGRMSFDAHTNCNGSTQSAQMCFEVHFHDHVDRFQRRSVSIAIMTGSSFAIDKAIFALWTWNDLATSVVNVVQISCEPAGSYELDGFILPRHCRSNITAG